MGSGAGATAALFIARGRDIIGERFGAVVAAGGALVDGGGRAADVVVDGAAVDGAGAAAIGRIAGERRIDADAGGAIAFDDAELDVALCRFVVGGCSSSDSNIRPNSASR